MVLKKKILKMVLKKTERTQKKRKEQMKRGKIKLEKYRKEVEEIVLGYQEFFEIRNNKKEIITKNNIKEETIEELENILKEVIKMV